MTEDKKPRILVLDWQLSTLTSLDSLLSREGNHVTTCATAAAAMGVLSGHKFDLVIAGRCGPERDGAVLVSKIKTLSPETRVLLLIEPEDDPMIADAIAAGADGLLRKTYTEGQVLQRVERLLRVAQVSHPTWIS